MKKIFFSAFVFLVTVSSCNKSSEIKPVDNLSQEVAQLKSMHKDGFRLATASFKKNLSFNVSKDLILHEKELSSDVFNGLKTSHFTASEDFISSLSGGFEDKNLTAISSSNTRETSNNVREMSSKADVSQLYNKNELVLVQPFLDELLETDDFVKVSALATYFQKQVTSSTLTRDEKIKLLSLGTSIQVLAENSEELISIITTQMQEATSTTVIRLRCSVSPRNVLLAGVTGLLYYGASGAIAGCTGGTVAFPGLGTVTGCVAGGIFGGAWGFIEGVGLGIAAELLGSCFR